MVQPWNMWAVNTLERKDWLHGAWRQSPKALLLPRTWTGSYLSSLGSYALGFHLGHRAVSAHGGCLADWGLPSPVSRVTSIAILLLHCISLITFPSLQMSHWAQCQLVEVRDYFPYLFFIPHNIWYSPLHEAHAPKLCIGDKGVG